jgi:hypothetical protein
MQSFYAANLFLSSPFLFAEQGRVKPVNIQVVGQFQNDPVAEYIVTCNGLNGSLVCSIF